MRLTQKMRSCSLSVVLIVAFVASACGGGASTATTRSSSGTAVPATSRTGSTPVAAPTGSASAAAGRAVLTGSAKLDGGAFDAQFVGARVIRNGLSSACQGSIPNTRGGTYSLEVVPDAEVRGCGVEGARIVLWVYTDRFIYSTQSIPWPGDGGSARFDATFSSAMPQGATETGTPFKGQLYARDGTQLGGGTVVEAYIADVLCGVTSLRLDNSTDGYYTLELAGPHAVAGCAEGAPITFRVNGLPAAETAVNDFGKGRDPGSVLDLHVR